MNQENIKWTGPILALVLAILPFPYGYYELLRILIFVMCVYFSWKEFPSNWSWGFIAFALVYNPIEAPVLGRGLWTLVNIGTAVFFYQHMQKTLRGYL